MNLKTCCVHNEFHEASWGPQLTCHHTCTPRTKREEEETGEDGGKGREMKRKMKKPEEEGEAEEKLEEDRKRGRRAFQSPSSPAPRHTPPLIEAS